MGVDVFLYWPGTQGVQLPSFDVDPSKVAGFFAEGLWKPLPAGQVMLVMFLHSVSESWYCPAGHMKTQQTSLMMTLLGAHGGAVELVVEVVLQPIVVHVCTLTVVTVEPMPMLLICPTIVLKFWLPVTLNGSNVIRTI